jgi:hypothetical protein
MLPVRLMGGNLGVHSSRHLGGAINVLVKCDVEIGRLLELQETGGIECVKLIVEVQHRTERHADAGFVGIVRVVRWDRPR